jgi:hypothetical protein
MANKSKPKPPKKKVVAKVRGGGFALTEDGKLRHTSACTSLDRDHYLSGDTTGMDTLRYFAQGIVCSLKSGRVANLRITFDILEQ